jgi:hypothetical protein
MRAASRLFCHSHQRAAASGLKSVSALRDRSALGPLFAAQRVRRSASVFAALYFRRKPLAEKKAPSLPTQNAFPVCQKDLVR